MSLNFARDMRRNHASFYKTLCPSNKTELHASLSIGPYLFSKYSSDYGEYPPSRNKKHLSLFNSFNDIHITVQSLVIIAHFIDDESVLKDWRLVCRSMDYLYFSNWRKIVRFEVGGVSSDILENCYRGHIYPSPRPDLLPNLLMDLLQRECKNGRFLDKNIHHKKTTKSHDSFNHDNNYDNAMNSDPKKKRLTSMTVRHIRLAEQKQRKAMNNAKQTNWLLDLRNVHQFHMTDCKEQRFVYSMEEILDNLETNSDLDNLDELMNHNLMLEKKPLELCSLSPRENSSQQDPLINIVRNVMRTFPESPKTCGAMFMPEPTPLSSEKLQEVLIGSGLKPKGLALEVAHGNDHLIEVLHKSIDWSCCEHLIIRMADDLVIGEKLAEARKGKLSLRIFPKKLKAALLSLHARRLLPPPQQLEEEVILKDFTWPHLDMVVMRVHVEKPSDIRQMVPFMMGLLDGSPNLKRFELFFIGPTNFPMSLPPSANWIDSCTMAAQILQSHAIERPTKIAMLVHMQRISHPESLVSQTKGYIFHFASRLVDEFKAYCLELEKRNIFVSEENYNKLVKLIMLIQSLQIPQSNILHLYMKKIAGHEKKILY